MKKRSIFVLAAILLFANASYAQTSCGDAAQSLVAYANQVNAVYANEWSRVIPYQRCPAVDALGRPFNPVIVQNCRLQMVSYLNTWYAQQCYFVNTTYAQVVRSCAIQQPPAISKPAPASDPDDGSQNSTPQKKVKINTKKINDLTAGIDENKTVRITIPDSPEGFTGN